MPGMSPKKSVKLLFCRAMLCKRGLCCHAVSVSLCLSVCVSVTFVNSVKTNKHINIFHRWVATPFQFFHAKRHSNTRTGTPLTGSSNAGVVGRNRDSELISGFNACC